MRVLVEDTRITYRPKELAKALGVSDRLVRDFMRERGLPYSRVGGVVLIRKDRLLEWLDEHEERNDGDPLAASLVRAVQAP